MKSLITSIVALTIASSASAQSWHSWDNPVEPFNAAVPRVFDSPIQIEWRIASNINAACEKESRRVGNGGFGGQDMQACSFWYGSKCVIITKKQPTMHTVGHELRHCFYGAWH